MNKGYWENIVNQLLNKDKANWAAHVLSTNIEIFSEIIEEVDQQKIIKNCLRCYEVDFSAQPYLDEVLLQFSVVSLINVYKQLEQKPIEVAGALMWLLEDIDPNFEWVS